jgi:hypothetical protein
MTTVETLMAIGISAVLLTQVCALWYYSSRSFAAQAAYTALDQDSQRALDRLSKDLRQASKLTGFNPTRVQLLDSSTPARPMEFSLDGRSLVRIYDGVRSIVLNNVDSLQFSMYQRTPVQGEWNQYATTNIARCKLLEVRWQCSRKLHPLSPSTTEYMQSAKIVMRTAATGN